jgi:hypothetical protein
VSHGFHFFCDSHKSWLETWIVSILIWLSFLSADG